MHRRPSAVASPLSPLAPQPLTPRRGYSAASQVSSPHTPPNRDSPLPLLAPASNRQSGDSWNSSIHDGADDDVTEWTQEQTRLLSRVRVIRVSRYASFSSVLLPAPSVLVSVYFQNRPLTHCLRICSRRLMAPCHRPTCSTSSLDVWLMPKAPAVGPIPSVQLVQR